MQQLACHPLKGLRLLPDVNLKRCACYWYTPDLYGDQDSANISAPNVASMTTTTTAVSLYVQDIEIPSN